MSARAAGQAPAGGAGLRAVGAATLLAAVVIAWAAAPLRGGAAGVVLTVAIICGAGATAQLALASWPARPPEREDWAGWDPGRALGVVSRPPWAQFLLVAVVVLEVMHPARPWHTAVLGLALLAYLLAVHLAETGAGAGALRPQLAVLASGLGLTALAVGAAALPSLPAGGGSSLLRAAAIVAAVIAAGLGVPAWLGRDR